jgi:hypothetical protein
LNHLPSPEMKHANTTPETDTGTKAKHIESFNCRWNLRWQMTYLAYIMVLLLFICFVFLRGGSGKRKINLLAINVDFGFHYFFVNICACTLDVLSIWHMSREVVCLKKSWMPTIGIEKRRNRLHLIRSASNIETYDMVHLKDITKFSKSECRLLAGLYMAGIVPWASLALFTGSTTFHLRERPLHLAGIIMGTITWSRVFFGTELLVKLYLAMVQLYTSEEAVRGEWAKHLFTGQSIFIAGYHCVIVGTYFTVLWIMLHGLDLKDSGYIYGSFYIITFLFGWVQGALQNAPVRPYYFLTDIAGDGSLIHFRKYDDWRSSKNFQWCSTIRSSDHWLMVFVDDHVVMSELLRGEGDE